MKYIIPLIFIGILLGGGGVASYSHYKQRGIRNNNPGNIERTKTKWVGMRSTQTDSRYLQFTDARYGIRALYKTLLTYRNNYGLNTIRGIISRWAPPNENDTASYIKYATKIVGISADTPITTGSQYLKLIKAIIVQENSINPYPDAEIMQGMRLALTS